MLREVVVSFLELFFRIDGWRKGIFLVLFFLFLKRVGEKEILYGAGCFWCCLGGF